MIYTWAFPAITNTELGIPQISHISSLCHDEMYEILYVQEVVIVSYYIKWGNYFLDTRYYCHIIITILVNIFVEYYWG